MAEAPAGTWVVDLDGVVWLTGTPLPGVGEAVGELRRAGFGVLFVTNNAEPTKAELRARLERAGIPAAPEEILSSADATASLVRSGDRVLAVGGAGLAEALAARGAERLDPPRTEEGRELAAVPEVAAVAVGLTRAFDFPVLAIAAAAARRCGRLIGTNEDPTHPSPEGLLPGSGALVAAVAVAAEMTPVYAGKPHAAMVDLVRQRASRIVAVVGDRPATDGRFAQRLGVPFCHVRSGVLAPGEAVDPPPQLAGDSLLAVVQAALADPGALDAPIPAG
ncbi:HAD-IIA family hydrolase [Aciditerrimonas ferrireducens]|uniref:HAD-IIA family hydrolase n=1 Tax=Aciditerrimonas ferrireducens TaxID=667306 RepID=A0ABV6C886_9ACTN